jgi:hypothetical protein
LQTMVPERSTCKHHCVRVALTYPGKPVIRYPARASAVFSEREYG